MKTLISCFFVWNIALFAQAVPSPETQTRPEKLPAQLGSRFRKWLTEDVGYIIAGDERRRFNEIRTDGEREQFIEEFWLRRDPTPDTVKNEYKEEHYRRLAYVNQRFASMLPGWKTDRGRTYIVYGPPDEIESHATVEAWRYRYVEGIGPNVTLRFVDSKGKGDFILDPQPR
jgi:GWxTD domain-containing protein